MKLIFFVVVLISCERNHNIKFNYDNKDYYEFVPLPYQYEEYYSKEKKGICKNYVIGINDFIVFDTILFSYVSAFGKGLIINSYKNKPSQIKCEFIKLNSDVYNYANTKSENKHNTPVSIEYRNPLITFVYEAGDSAKVIIEKDNKYLFKDSIFYVSVKM